MSLSWSRREQTMAVRRATSDDVDAITRVHVATWRHAYRGHVPDAALDALAVEPRRAMWQRIVGTEGHPAHVFVAEEDGEVCGFAASGPLRDDDADGAGGADAGEGSDDDRGASTAGPVGADRTTGELYALYVAPQAQGRGHGSRLLQAAEADLVDRGHASAVLWVLATNATSIGFYEVHGWRDDGVDDVQAMHGVEVRDRRYRKALG